MRRALWVMLALAILAGGAAGLWIHQGKRLPWVSAPLTVRGTVQTATADVNAVIGGRVRLVAVRDGSTVKAGQLLAWLDVPELREAVDAAQDEVRDAQRQLDALRAQQSDGPKSAYARAQAAASEAERELERAQELAMNVPVLAQKEEAAALAQAEAEIAYQDAVTVLAEAQARAATGASGGANSDLPSPDGATAPEAGSVTIQPAEDPAVANAQAALDAARKRKNAADRELEDTRRRHRAAVEASENLVTLSERAQAAAIAVTEARDALEAASTRKYAREEERLRATLRQAQAEASRTRALLRDATVLAPAPGVVERVHVSRGDELTPGASVVTLRRLDTAWVEVQIPEAEAPRVRANQSVDARAANHSLPFPGKVISVARRTAGQDSPLIAQISLTDLHKRLRPGEVVTITIK